MTATEIVILVNDWGEDPLTDSERELLAALLAESEYVWADGWSEPDTEPATWVVRATRRGEAEGIYYRRSDGTLQILGYSISMPEGLNHVINAAWDKLVDVIDVIDKETA